ncbi:hypothetical protein K505DRAFT_325787 [Melanomma pulvis-pyrius CBS 109.77]|uniref:Uncharacterized protein n=1 Tax=Melanomma pulvis-pyrius CBS 109.77 TaxID=1314802 RepID=A0A6A6X9F4_9PLEO|nr:hypothetical protein K505DRAFT_325787 [Melanomma pulvis-pyrius CBS 109.77]
MAPFLHNVRINVRAALSPMAVHDMGIAKRAAPQINPGAGARPPNDFNNIGFQVLFALIGMGMVLTAMWFFFWAKNGGFKFEEHDWEDYKSTVLRRKGPDGKTLSNATKSTRLGGGSVVHGGSYGNESSVGYTDETGTSADSNEMREVEEGNGRKFGLRGGDDRTKPERRESMKNYKDPELRKYRHERPARVGGLNRQADGMYTDYSNTEPSELGSNVSGRPLVKDKKQEAKDKEARARERMRLAKLAEKNQAKFEAAEAKAKKAADKERAKRAKAEQKKTKKTKTVATPSEAAPSEAPMSEYPISEAPMSEAPMSVAPILVPSPARRAPPSAAYSFVSGDDAHTVTNTVYTGTYTATRSAPSVSEHNESSYYSDYRPNADPSASRARGERRERRQRDSQSQSQSQTQSRRAHSSSPRKQNRPSRQSDVSDIFTQNNGNVQGTIAYPCYIPGLSSAGSVGVSESVSQVGGPSQGAARRQRDVMDGYRRGGVRAVARRDSLSDSDS